MTSRKAFSAPRAEVVFLGDIANLPLAVALNDFVVEVAHEVLLATLRIILLQKPLDREGLAAQASLDKNIGGLGLGLTDDEVVVVSQLH